MQVAWWVTVAVMVASGFVLLVSVRRGGGLRRGGGQVIALRLAVIVALGVVRFVLLRHVGGR